MQDKIIRLRKGRSGQLRAGHPWIFKSSILKITSNLKPGDIATVITNEGKFIGRGYYNPRSIITARLLTFKDEVIDSAFLQKTINAAVTKRDFLKDITDAKRLVFSEADSLPGLIADMYGDTLVFQVFTLGMEQLKELALEAIKDTISPKFIYERSDSPFRKKEGLKIIKEWRGQKGPDLIEITEGTARFLVDVEKGHKTGFYLDQRKSRLALSQISKGKTALDLFCYTGGFSINAALGGAKKVTGVDIKKEWLELARKNSSLNNISEKIDFIAGDAFSVLKKTLDAGDKFDIIVLDPPSFAKGRESVVTAVKGYKELNTLAFKALNPGGILCTFSCSHHISNDIFSDMLKKSAEAAGRKFTILKRCHQDKDHPIIKSIPETEYLKGYFLAVV